MYLENIFRFYVYAYLRKDLTPYYIGKGTKHRAWVNHRVNNTGVHTPKDHSRIVILEDNISNIGAIALERRMIRWYGRKNLGTGILLNRTDGGEDAPRMFGDKNPAKNPENREKIRLSKIGIPRDKTTKTKLSIATTEYFKHNVHILSKEYILTSPTNTFYINTGLRKFCEANHISFGTIKLMLKKNGKVTKGPLSEWNIIRL